MHKTLVSLAAAASLLLATLAHADTINGTVQSVDMESGEIVLEDGQSFIANEDFDLSALEPGTSVTIEFSDDGENNVVEDIAVEE